MAKRKRLSAPNPDFVTQTPALETKSLPVGKAPIAGVAADAATTAAFDEIADELGSARREGRMILSLPLAAIEMDYLVRDRIAEDDEAMQALMASLRARGQQVPIEVTELAPGRYGLISGWRRCQALTRLGAGFERVNAIVRQSQEASEAYLAMVEENEIRVGLSYYERARIVVKATQQGVFPDERAALAALFQAGSRARRSKIGTFVHIVKSLDGSLRFPGALTERVGLILGRALQERPVLADVMAKDLTGDPAKDAATEASRLLRLASKKETNKAKSVSNRDLPVMHPCDGVTLKTHKDGSLTLSGPRVDGALRDRVLRWLAAGS